jgi:peptidoglycan/LPS O-acetylase OafA/YrhL
MQTDSSARTKPAPIFSLRHNWKHLANRPEFEEPVIDGVRAIAILWVIAFRLVYYHIASFPLQTRAIATNLATSWIVRGILGVDLFFVISGFLLGSMLFSEFAKSGSLEFSRFYVRRFLRLIPVYTAVMVIALYFSYNLPHLPEWGNAQNVGRISST